MSDRSYIAVSEGVTASNALALCGCSPSHFAPINSPSFTTCIVTPIIQVTTGAAAGYVLTSDVNGVASWQAPTGGGGLVWTGSTNNGIGTYSSSGTICSEPNLTFDGSALMFGAGSTRYICFGTVGSDTLCIYGATTNTAKGGDIKIEAGEGFTTTGGTVCIIAGQGDIYGRVALVQQYIERLATTTTGVLICGNIGLATGAERTICFNEPASGGTGSPLIIVGNQGASTSTGGVVRICGGEGGSTSGGGGALCLYGGRASSGDGGNVHIGGGSSSTRGGCVTITGGRCNDVKIYVHSRMGIGAKLIFHACYNNGNSYAGLHYNGQEKFKTLSDGICVIGCGFSTDWIASSDCRLKTDIRPISNALSTVTRLEGVSYKLCDDSMCECHIGLIAQDVEKYLPEVVSHSQPSEDELKYGITDDKLGIKYGKLTAVLVEAIKELETKVQNLELEIKKLKTC